jgi:Zn-dependent protease
MSETAVPQTPPQSPPPQAPQPPPGLAQDRLPARPPDNWVGVGLVAAWLALGAWILTAPTGIVLGLAVFGFVMVGWVLAVMAHEFAHAATAYAAGDWTVRPKGYLSFDPRRYGDLGVSLVIPLIALALGGVGFPGGAVYLRNDLMRSRLWRSAASLAGPAATLVVLVVLAFGLSFWAGWGVEGRGPTALFCALSIVAFLQAMALILNLLPIPGLDGFNAIRPWLPAAWTPGLRRIEGLTMVLILLAIFYAPGVSRELFAASARLAVSVGLIPDALREGWALFHFWQR